MIEKITENELILLRNNERYYFKKLLIQKNKGFFNQPNDYKIIGKDTIRINFRASFHGDIIKYFSINKNKNPSFIVNVSFILRKNNSIDSIIVDSLNLSDTSTISETIRIIQNSQKKWIPAQTLNHDKIDSKFFISVLFKSSELLKLSNSNYYDLGEKIFAKAIAYQNNNQNDLAELLYTDYISMYQFFIYSISAASGYIESLNSGLINRAALRFKTGKTSEACQDLKLVNGNKKDAEEAEKYIKE